MICVLHKESWTVHISFWLVVGMIYEQKNSQLSPSLDFISKIFAPFLKVGSGGRLSTVSSSMSEKLSFDLFFSKFLHIFDSFLFLRVYNNQLTYSRVNILLKIWKKWVVWVKQTQIIASFSSATIYSAYVWIKPIWNLKLLHEAFKTFIFIWSNFWISNSNHYKVGEWGFTK